MQDDKLTLRETEQLCRQYMDCSLSVLEETELRYFLTQVDYHSPLIDEVRGIMDIDSFISAKPVEKVSSRRKRMFGRWPVYAGIAASIAAVIGIGASIMKQESDTVVIAYAQGRRLNAEQALKQSKADMEMAEDFIKRMTDIGNSEQQIIEEFFNTQSL